MAQPTQTRRIIIKVDTSESKALNEIANRMGLLNRNTKSLAGSMGFLTNAFRGWLGFLGIRELAKMSDEMQSVGNRLRIITGSTQGAQDALAQIAGVADRTNQSVQSVGETFSRFGQVLRNTGATTSEVSSLTEALINTFRVAGTSTAETSNTLIQLSQAFSSGKLSGDELRSVLEQNVVLAGQLREKFGKDLAAKAKAGLVTTSVVLGVIAENMKRVDEESQKLAPTFEQTLTKSMNTVTLGIGELNDKFGLSTKFATIMAFAVENLSTVLILAASAALPAMISGIVSLAAAMKAFALSNPILAALTAVVAIGALVYDNWETLSFQAKKLSLGILDLAASFIEYLLPALSKVPGYGDKIVLFTVDTLKGIRSQAKDMRKEISELEEARRGKSNTGPTLDQKYQALLDLQAKVKAKEGANTKVEKLKDILGALNKEFDEGKISAQEYFAKLASFDIGKLTREFKEGKIDLFKYHEGLRDLNIRELNRDLDTGKISMTQFNQAVSEEKFKVLSEQFKYGKITLSEYNNEVLKLEGKFAEGSPLRAGTEAYVKSIGTLGENVAKGITQAFGHLEDNLFDFVKTGKFEFSKFTQAILDDLTKIIIRASIIKPFADAILSGLGSGATAVASGSSDFGNNHIQGGGPLASAKGNAFMGGNVLPFARGGIVDTPTGFTYGGGRRGVMGEAGPEAILPLSRTGTGKLGVEASVTPVTVNIINQSGAAVQQTETTGPSGERQIDILISSKVRDGIVSGRYDTAMRQAYGISRRGS